MSQTDEATDWAARMDAGPLTQADRVRLYEWLAAEPLNKGALLRAQAMLCLIYEAPERAVAAGDHPAGMAEAEPEVEAGATTFRRRRWMAGAASLAAVAAAVLVLLPGRPVSAEYATRTGEVRRVALDDGSRAIINTGSQVETAIGSAERSVTLASGEAWFNVVKDRDRPFTVQAGPIRVTAVGTAFAVRRDASSVTVTVTEGQVEIRNDARPEIVFSAKAGEATTIPFAARLTSTARILPARESALSWRDGDIVLDGMTLQAAVEEFNRYNIRQVTIASPQIARRSMVGYFRINQPEQFAAAAAELVSGSVVHDGNTIVIKP